MGTTYLEILSIAKCQKVVMTCLLMIMLGNAFQFFIIHGSQAWSTCVFTQSFRKHVQMVVVLVSVKVSIMLDKHFTNKLGAPLDRFVMTRRIISDYHNQCKFWAAIPSQYFACTCSPD